ncbi:aldo/keto reductase [Thalassospiraceae bacterium LMO-SO8]|nr:aldo/keto reductase [Alphaproteobacteria bacterium LMO-S08]WND77190.1 aldo/keto reductase [Thalassospiraceae bacterium LMO-SO8]
MLTRRRFLERTALAGLAAVLPGGAAAAAPIIRTIPRTGAAVPVIGMGSWLTFDVGDDASARAARTRVLKTFFALGGGMIDSSPMYGSSEAVIGHGLAALGKPEGLFAATKVWTPGQDHGIRQMAASERLWGIERFDLLQVHNLLGWEGHLETLLDWKAQGRVRHIGITTSHGRRHDELARIMTSQPIDFVQLTYNIDDREAEQRLLPLAAEKGIAVIANRPFQRGALMDRLQGRPLPPVAAEIGAANWAQVLLKWIVAHPAVTCAIPATTRVDHMQENMGAARGPLPDAKMRREILTFTGRL